MVVDQEFYGVGNLNLDIIQVSLIGGSTPIKGLYSTSDIIRLFRSIYA